MKVKFDDRKLSRHIENTWKKIEQNNKKAEKQNTSKKSKSDKK